MSNCSLLPPSLAGALPILLGAIVPTVTALRPLPSPQPLAPPPSPLPASPTPPLLLYTLVPIVAVVLLLAGLLGRTCGCGWGFNLQPCVSRVLPCVPLPAPLPAAGKGTAEYWPGLLALRQGPRKLAVVFTGGASGSGLLFASAVLRAVEAEAQLARLDWDLHVAPLEGGGSAPAPAQLRSLLAEDGLVLIVCACAGAGGVAAALQELQGILASVEDLGAARVTEALDFSPLKGCLFAVLQGGEEGAAEGGQLRSACAAVHKGLAGHGARALLEAGVGAGRAQDLGGMEEVAAGSLIPALLAAVRPEVAAAEAVGVGQAQVEI